MNRYIDLTGQRFGRLVIIEYICHNKYGQSLWLCKCDCGNETIVMSNHLKTGHTKSCGCLQKENHRNNIKYGHTRDGKISKTYIAWYNMLQRCNNKNHPKYKYYGGRGIEVCERWLKFQNFLEDIGEIPIGKEIDRKDNNGNYCLENCRLITRKENNQNKRKKYHRINIFQS